MMKTQCAVLVALSMASIAVNSAPLYAQRHGRPDGVQMYARSIPAPELEVQWTVQHERDRWRAADLETMDAHTVVALSKHSAPEVVSGVRLGDLLAKRGTSDAPVLEVHYGLVQKKTLHWQELDPNQTIVVTRRNGSLLQEGVWLVAVDTHARSITIRRVSKIVVKTPPH